MDVHGTVSMNDCAHSDCPVIMVSFHENHTAIWFRLGSEAEVVPQAKKKRKKVVKRVQVLLNQ